VKWVAELHLRRAILLTFNGQAYWGGLNGNQHRAPAIHIRARRHGCRIALTARAQQPALPVVGFVRDGSADTNARYVAAFRKGLNETGYIEART